MGSSASPDQRVKEQSTTRPEHRYSMLQYIFYAGNAGNPTSMNKRKHRRVPDVFLHFPVEADRLPATCEVSRFIQVKH